MDDYIAELKNNFSLKGFRINDSNNTPQFPFLYSASKVRFDIVGAPTFLEEFFIFSELPSATKESIDGFTESASRWAIANENKLPKSAELPKKAVKLILSTQNYSGPLLASQLDKLSVRESVCLVYIYAIAIASTLSEETIQWLESQKSARTNRVGAQATFLVPIFCDLKKREFIHFRKRPLLGNVFYTEARKVISKNLFL